ncbi:MAG: hypothetical protein EPN70_13985 [Paraburkholderia sp.]|uniref:hypothetical protein n=1 Tax=Paraburkholderia sp. TaxID=1926495 RepID=UPI001211A024|nr:hypothetical protein [Paraburkholderia sp.]TAM03532.1 MAG: hypothetical protein EPN70_13985 [Paraburkholderia sp.]TAM32692.1 MAG: hypothetical protein EPN59_02000 [Paraburkholderia sp.]
MNIARDKYRQTFDLQRTADARASNDAGLGLAATDAPLVAVPRIEACDHRSGCYAAERRALMNRT